MAFFKKYARAFLFIYWNMYFNRSKVALGGLMLLAVYSTWSVYDQLSALGVAHSFFVVAFSASSLLLWVVGFPCVVYLIDASKNPLRLKAASDSFAQKFKA